MSPEGVPTPEPESAPVMVFRAVPAPEPTKRRRRVLVLVAAVVVAAVVVGGGAFAAVTLLRESTAQEAVRGYFAKLAAGDAAGALSYVERGPGPDGDWAARPLLTDAQLADPANRPADLVIVKSRRQDGRNGGVLEVILVTYTAGGNDYSQLIDAYRSARREPFLLRLPFLALDVADEPDGEWSYQVGGVPIDTWPTLAFPGAYTATREGNALYAQATADGVPRLNTAVDFRFSPVLADGAQAVAQAAVDSYLDGCTRDHSMDPATLDGAGTTTTCPFGLDGDQPLTVTWSIASYPQIEVTMADDGVSFDSTADGLVRYDLPAGWKDGQFAFGVAGWLGVDGSTVKVYTNYTG